jgi:hypothetical protein
MLKKIAGAAILLASASAHAHAQSQPQPLGVWDSQGLLIGNLAGQDRVDLMLTPGRPFALTVFPSGFPQEAEFLYSTPDCSGERYLDAGTLPIPGYVFYGQIFYPGPLTTIDAKATGGYNSAGQFGCSPWDQGTRTVAPALVSRTPYWIPPFCVSATKVRCN